MGRWAWCLAAVTAVAAVLRVPGLDDPLVHDEGFSWLVAASPSADVFLGRLAATENTPPLLYALLALGGADGAVALRLPSFVAGVALVPVVAVLGRVLLGSRVAGLLAALVVAVAPEAVANATLSRAFALETLGLVVAVLGSSCVAVGRVRPGWGLWVAGGVVALYAGYDAGLTLLAAWAALVALRVRPWREVAGVGVVPVLLFLPWLGQAARAADRIDETKAAPSYPGPSPVALRDELLPVFAGEAGRSAPGALRWAGLAVLLAVCGWAGRVLWARRDRRPAVALLGGTALGSLGLHAVVPAVGGPSLFSQRYLTVVLPLVALLVAGAVVAVASSRRWVVGACAAVLAVSGGVLFVDRLSFSGEPAAEAVRAAVERSGAEVVLTNSAVVVHTVRDRAVILDRAFGLGPGLEERCSGEPYAVVDDPRVAGGARGGPGPGGRRLVGGGRPPAPGVQADADDFVVWTPVLLLGATDRVTGCRATPVERPGRDARGRLVP